jgi:pilus assembly protein CpaB
MKMKTSVSMVVALVLGLITAKVGVDLMKNYRGAAPLTSRVVLAKKSMNPGHVVVADDLDTQTVAVNLVPANALHEPKELIGRTVIANVAPGQTMLESLLVGKNAGSGLAAVLKPGMRAVAVDVSDSSAVAGLIDRGSKVDVIATLRRGDQTIAKAVVENVEVQAVQRAVSGYTRRDGQTAPIENGPVKSVTLLVTPKQASAIDLAKANGGTPRLVLRGNGDVTAGNAQMSDRELLGLPEIPEKEEPVAKTEDIFENLPPIIEDKGRPIEIIRGGAASTVYIEEKNKEEGTDGTTASAKLKPSETSSGKSNAKRRVSQEQ